MQVIDPATTTWSKEEVLGVASDWREKARKTLLEDGYHRPISFVFSTKNHETGEDRKSVGIVPVFEDFNDDFKTGYSQALREIVQKTGGVGIIFISEVWMVSSERDNGMDGPDSPEARKWRGKLDKHPDRVEQLMMSCEHYRFGCLTWMARIYRESADPESKITSLGPWLGEGRFPTEEERPSNIKKTGRFVNILPRVS